MAVESDLVPVDDIGPVCIAIRSRRAGLPPAPVPELEGEVAPVRGVVLVRGCARREELGPRVADLPRSREHSSGASGVCGGGGDGAGGRCGGGGRAGATWWDGQRGAGRCVLLELLDLPDERLGLRVLLEAGVH